MNKKIKELKIYLKKQKIDFFILPNNDQFNNEYLPESAKRIEFLTGFNGSNAILIITAKKIFFFTDGRYILQAQKQLNPQEFTIFDLSKMSLLKWLVANVKKGQNVALDANLHSKKQVSLIQGHLTLQNANLTTLKDNPVDMIWPNRPDCPSQPVFILENKYCGENITAKMKKLKTILDKNADALFLNFAPSINWLLNIRSSDVAYSPLALCQALIYKNGKIDLFIEATRLNQEVRKYLRKNKVNIVAPTALKTHLQSIKRNLSVIQIDPNYLNFSSYDILTKQKFTLVENVDPVLALKAVKNKTEIANNILTHEKDGLALTKFLFWLTKNPKNNSEIKAAERLLNFRQEDKDFLYPSFETISGFGPNGAIIHYKADGKSNKKFGKNNLYLVDSGGQYLGGTTDVTRTVAIGKAGKDHIANFTRVVKGHIAIARSKFPIGTCGDDFDILARYHLWQDFKDYAHGTGHGVGQFLSVHESPPSISKRNSGVTLKAGMILSNEPGYYENGKYGIRIENLMLVEPSKNKDFLQFRTLTLAPIDPLLIDFKMLTYPEKKWLLKYHEEILKKFNKKLEEAQKEWLESLVKIYQKPLEIRGK